MTIEQRIRELIEPSVEAMGYDVVRVRLTGASTSNRTLQIMADRQDEAPITVEDCADISRAVSAILDVEDPITDAYNLEVSSPGIDRPLTRARDFERWAGFEAKIETARPIDGRKRYRGRVLGLENERVVLDMEGARAAVPFAEIAEAKLVLTDDLLAHAQAEQEAAGFDWDADAETDIEYYDADDAESDADEGAYADAAEEGEEPSGRKGAAGRA